MEAWSPNHWTPGKSLPSAHKDIDLKFSCLKEHPFLPLLLVPQVIDLQMLELQGSIFGICLSAPLGGKVPRLFPECQTGAFSYPLYSGSASQILHFQNRILDFLSPKFAPGSPYQWMISLFFQVLKWRTLESFLIPHSLIPQILLALSSKFINNFSRTFTAIILVLSYCSRLNYGPPNGMSNS